jgi:hypothetical protein
MFSTRQLASRVILAGLCLGSGCLAAAAAPTDASKLCSGSEATIRCLEHNFDLMSHSQQHRFWAILNDAARDLGKRAPKGEECESTGKLVQFLSLSRVRPVSAEFSMAARSTNTAADTIRWSELTEFVRRDDRFLHFIVRHIDGTIPATTLDSIEHNAREKCPESARNICHIVLMACRDLRQSVKEQHDGGR